MFKLAILLLLVAYVLAIPAPVKLRPQLDGRIVGGIPTTISFTPWQISIQYGGAHFCGGSIYSEYIIVTAAHCLHYEIASTLKVRAGSSFWNSGGVLVQVADFKIHDHYDSYTMINDVGVMRLATPLTFKSTIKPIPLATVAPGDGEDAITSGWGTKLSGADTLPTQLQVVQLKTVSLTTCASDLYEYGNDVHETMICTYTEDKDSCQGDSGGPLVSDGKLVGIVSWGNGCAFRNLPGVYTDVAALRGWIESAGDSF